jgi:hypothetical protein
MKVTPLAGGALAVGDDAGYPHALAGGCCAELGGGRDAGRIEVGADVMHGVAVGGDAGGPQVGHGVPTWDTPGSVGGGPAAVMPAKRFGLSSAARPASHKLGGG